MRKPKLIEIEITVGSGWQSRHVGRIFKAYSQTVYDYSITPKGSLYQIYDKEYGHYHKCLVQYEYAKKVNE